MTDLCKFQVCFLGGFIFFLFLPCKKEETKAAFHSVSQTDFCITLGTILLHRAELLGSPFIQFSARFRTINSECTFLHMFMGNFDYDFIDILNIKSLEMDRNI